MDETDRGKVVRFFLAGSVLCLVGMFFFFLSKRFYSIWKSVWKKV